MVWAFPGLNWSVWARFLSGVGQQPTQCHLTPVVAPGFVMCRAGDGCAHACELGQYMQRAALCETSVHLRYIWLKKIGRTREGRLLEGARTHILAVYDDAAGWRRAPGLRHERLEVKVQGLRLLRNSGNQ